MAKNFTNTKATGRMSNYNNMTMATDAAEMTRGFESSYSRMGEMITTINTKL